MLFAIADAAWRALLLLALGVAPYAAPVDAIGARTAVVASVRLALFLAVVVGLTLVARRCARAHPVLAALCASLAIAAPVVAAVVSGERGPLARGAWILAPLVWGAIAAVVGGPLASLRSKPVTRSARVAFAAVALLVGAASLVAAAPRLKPRGPLWRTALALNPGDEHAAIAVAADLRAKHERRAALDALLACSRTRPAQCRCSEAAAGDAIDLGRFADARTALDGSRGCARSPHRIALEAETSIGTGAVADGRREADVAYTLDPNDPHAVYARAWGASIAGEAESARSDAARAAELGRGEPAQLLLGVLLFRANDLAAAEASFREALTALPDDPRATYDLALVADRRQQYRDAREGYLHVLRLDPAMADARYNLAVLTYSRGAIDEARHHVDAFATSFPADPRIVDLQHMLAAPPPRRAMTMGQ